MKMMFTVLAALGVYALAACLGGRGLLQLDGERRSVSAVEGEVERIMRKHQLPGLQVAVVTDTQLVYTRGFGVRDAASGAPVTSRTVFGALSFSKPIFATLVLQMAEEGLIDLDAPLEGYLTEPLTSYDFYADLRGDPRVGRLTARMALSHTTGLPNWRFLEPGGRLRFAYDPGARHSYSGEGYFLLQQVVQVITGEPLAALAARRLFEPLGLRRTSFVFLPGFEDDFAVGHNDSTVPLRKERPGEANAAGSAQTTAEDFARFLIAVLRREVMSDASTRAAFSSQIRIEHARMFGSGARRPALPAAPKIHWGLGWGLVESDRGDAFFHTGSEPGSANYHVGFLESGIAVVLLANSGMLNNAAAELTRALVGDTVSPFYYLGYREAPAR